MTERNVYHDRKGNPHLFEKGMTKISRQGAFVILRHEDKILCEQGDYALETPSLPGGGIDEGEDEFQAALRELQEETGVVLDNSVRVEKKLTQNVRYYADEDDEYWDYKQTYFLLNYDSNQIYFEGVREVEGGKTKWLSKNSLTIHAMHQKALKYFELI